MNSQILNLAGRKIGFNYRPLIIPEIGINHGGSLETAIKIVDEAKKCGAEIIKHQTILPDDDYSEESKNLKLNILGKKNLFSLLKKLSLSAEKEFKLKKYVEKKSMIFLSTPFSKKGVDRLIKFDVKAFKVGSGEFSNETFVKYIAKFNKPMILSTGMHNLKEIDRVVVKLKRINNRFALLHCTSIYPTPDDKVRLNSILQMQKRYSRVIGLSDHTNNCLSSFGAVALGACIIEKHFVDKKTRKGPDINSSIDSKGLNELIKGCETIFKQRNGDKNEILKQEERTKKFALPSIVSNNVIKKGEKFSLKNLILKRPGNGEFKIKDFKYILKRKAKVDIFQNVQIKKKWISN
jgi:N-acetylneuraminate synthase